MKFLYRLRPRKTQKPTPYSLIDVGRDSTKAAIVLAMPGNEASQIVGYGQAASGGHDIAGGRMEADAITSPVNEALTQAEDSTEKFIGRKIVPDDAIFVLAGRATVGELFTVKQTRPKPTEPISAKEFDNLRQRAERMVRQGLGAAADGGHWQPLAVTDAGIRLDDHLVVDCLGLMGRELSLSVFGVAGQAAALRALEVLANRLDLAIANIVAAPQALASLAPHTEAIMLDIGTSGTDVCLIRDDALIAADWTPFGGYFFTQSLARAMDLELEEAKALKHAFAKGELSKKETVRLNSALAAPRQRWYGAVVEVLTDLSGAEPLPRRIYLSGGGSMLPGLDKLLRANPEPFGSAPEVNWLSNQALPAMKDMTDALDYNVFALTLSLTVGLPV